MSDEPQDLSQVIEHMTYRYEDPGSISFPKYCWVSPSHHSDVVPDYIIINITTTHQVCGSLLAEFLLYKLREK